MKETLEEPLTVKFTNDERIKKRKCKKRILLHK